MSRLMSKEQRDLLKQEHSEFFLLVRNIINQLDPVGLLKMGAPEDEHDSLTGQVLILLLNDRVNEVRQFIIDFYEVYGVEVDKVLPEYKDSFFTRIDETTKLIEELYKGNN